MMMQVLAIPDSIVEAAEKEESDILLVALINPGTGKSRQFFGSIAPVESSRILDVVDYTPGEKIDLCFTFNIFSPFFFYEES